jgi:hypothetical protein
MRLVTRILHGGLAGVALFVLGLAGALPAGAQTAAPVPAPTMFTMSGNYAAFTGAKTTTSAVIASAAIRILPEVSVGYEHNQVNAVNARWELGVVAYTRQLNSLLGSTISSKLLVDTSQIGVTFSAGAGKLLQPTANRIAETVGVHVSYPLADHISLQILGVDYLHGGVQNGLLTVNSTANISTGVNIYF